jgi:hypothetical protein
MQTPKSRGGGGTPFAVRGFFREVSNEPQLTDFRNTPQDLFEDGANPEPDRRRSDWCVQAMVGALRVLTGDRYLRPFRINSAEDQELGRVKVALEKAILRRRKNLRRVVGGRRL